MDILDMILSDYTMIICWGGLIGFVVYMGLHVKIEALFIFAGSALPIFIFHLYGLFNIWNDVNLAHIYSRVSQVVLVIGLVVSLSLICRLCGSMFNEHDDLPNL